MDKKIIIAPIDSNSEEPTLFLPIKEFPVDKIILLTYPEGVVKAEQFKQSLARLNIETNIVKIIPTGNLWEDFFSIVSSTIEDRDKNDFIINISTAD